MKRGSKDKSGTPIKKQQHEPAPEDDQSVGDQLLARLLKLRVPIVPDPDPPTSPTKSRAGATLSNSGTVEERMMKAYPGLTKEEIDEMAKALGFI